MARLSEDWPDQALALTKFWNCEDIDSIGDDEESWRNNNVVTLLKVELPASEPIARKGGKRVLLSLLFACNLRTRVR